MRMVFIFTLTVDNTDDLTLMVSLGLKSPKGHASPTHLKASQHKLPLLLTVLVKERCEGWNGSFVSKENQWEERQGNLIP